MLLGIQTRKDTNGSLREMERTGAEPKARKMIGLNFQTKSFLKTSVFGVYTRVLHRTLVNITNEYMGFQSALYNPTHGDAIAI
jgi:hypothetical protein